MLVIAIKVASGILRGQHQAVEKIQSQFQAWMGPEAARAITPLIDTIIHQSTGRMAAVFSIVLVILSVGNLPNSSRR